MDSWQLLFSVCLLVSYSYAKEKSAAVGYEGAHLTNSQFSGSHISPAGKRTPREAYPAEWRSVNTRRKRKPRQAEETPRPDTEAFFKLLELVKAVSGVSGVTPSPPAVNRPERPQLKFRSNNNGEIYPQKSGPYKWRSRNEEDDYPDDRRLEDDRTDWRKHKYDRTEDSWNMKARSLPQDAQEPPPSEKEYPPYWNRREDS